MHLAYLDDSGSDLPNSIVLSGAVVVKDDYFESIEDSIAKVIDRAVPPDKQDDFTEFHAVDLFGGNGIFKGVSEEERYAAIRYLLGMLKAYRMPFIYSAIDKRALSLSPFGSAEPLDVAFRMCALGIEEWIDRAAPQSVFELGGQEIGRTPLELCLFIHDDTDSKPLKITLRKSFRALRARHRGTQKHSKRFRRDDRLWHVHDDMYFGSSADSIGLQVADLCNYFMFRYLKTGVADEFFELVRPHAICAKPQPEWGQYKAMARAHDAA
jgi:hypothetical protein